MGAEHVKPRTYFDIVSIDALQQIIRHLSERARTASWHEHVPPSTAGMLYSTRNLLCDAAAQSLTALNALAPTNLQPGELRASQQRKQTVIYPLHSAPQHMSSVTCRLVIASPHYPAMIGLIRYVHMHIRYAVLTFVVRLTMI
eukprot:IDg8655t1